MKAADISIDAASQADITRLSITKAITQLAKDGGKITQDAIADLADVSQGWVSKFFAGLGGWGGGSGGGYCFGLWGGGLGADFSGG